MDATDIQALTDEEFDELQALVLADQRRRFTLRQIPADIAELAQEYRSSGGDEQALIDALTPEQVAALDT